jgi:hypothetical protein
MRWLGLTALCFAVSCSGKSGGGGGPDGGAMSPDGGTMTVDQACERDASSYCDKLAACSMYSLQTLWGDVATCKARDRLWCKAVLGVEGGGETPEAITTCADAVDAQSCDDFNSAVTLDVCKTKPGPLADGLACTSAYQCESLSCKAPANSTCKACTPKVAVGGACMTSSDCASGSRCRQQQCVPQVAEGAACGGTVGVCNFSDICLNGACTKLLKPGSACDPMADACDYGTFGATCDAQSNTCKVVAKVVGAGQPCGTLPDGPTDCSAFGVCGFSSPDATVGTCFAALPDGAPCDPMNVDNQCFWPAACVDGICKVQFSSMPAGCPR